MKKAKIPLLVALTIVLPLGISCSRAPKEGPPPASAGSSDAAVNGTLAEQPQESSGPPADLSSPNQGCVVVVTPPDPGSADDPSTGPFSSTQIDLNSGDLRSHRFFIDGPPPYVISASKLSKEVRRLGIPIPEERRWMVIWSLPSGMGMHVTYVYRNLLPEAGRLLELFDEVKATDDERRDVLERLMTSLRMEKPPDAIAKVRMLITEVCGRHGL